MKKKIIALLLFLAVLMGLLAGCGAADAHGAAEAVLDLIEAVGDAQTAEEPESAAPAGPDKATAGEDAPQAEMSGPEEENTSEFRALPEDDGAAIIEDGEYSSPEDVAEYLHIYGKLPGNFITKKEAQQLGWDSSKGNLWDVAPGKSIGGDYFGNYEGLLPEGRYHECDVNYAGGYRGAERLIYSEDGSVWYTSDHYESFTQLY